jgi:pyruvate dehydrogenase E2 component (dihydrolipoamide acetyltransferase)
VLEEHYDHNVHSVHTQQSAVTGEGGSVATEVVIPMLGVTVEKGKIVEWLKKEGYPVLKGESLFVVEADKVTTEVESPIGGILAKILLPAGQTVPVLTLAAIITEPGEPLPEKYETAGKSAVAAAAADCSHPEEAVEPRQPTSTGPADRVRIVPAARKLAQEKGITLENLTGTGPGGVICLQDVHAADPLVKKKASLASALARREAERLSVPLADVTGTGVRDRIMRADVEKAASRKTIPGLGRVIPMNTMRQVISRRMSESAFTAPHIYFFTDVHIDALMDFQAQIYPGFERRFALHLSINDLLIKAVAANILDFPLLNAFVKEDEVHIQPTVNVGLAVALADGLIVPAVAGAESSSLAEIVRQRTDLVERARKGKLDMAEMERGTFTISSLARYDITHFTAILNPPQSGILSVGKVREELYLNGKTVKTRRIFTLGLSVDHRIIDGVVAADFLQNLKQKLETPLFTFTCL